MVYPLSKNATLASLTLLLISVANCSAGDTHTSALALDTKSLPLTANRVGEVVFNKNVIYKSSFENIEDLKFSNDGKSLVIAGGDAAETGGVEILAWPSKKLLHRIEPHDDVAWQAAWSPDDSRIVTASQDGTCCVIEVQSGKLLRTFVGHSKAVTAVTFVTQDIVVSGGLDNTLRVWDPTKKKTIRSLNNHTNAIRDVSLRPDHEGLPMVASAGRDRTVRLWQPTIGRMVRFARLNSAPLAVCWATDGLRLFVSCEDGSVRQLDPDTMAEKVIHTADGLRAWCIACARNGRSVFFAGERGQTAKLVLSHKN
jgi:WD40 repeat protein